MVWKLRWWETITTKQAIFAFLAFVIAWFIFLVILCNHSAMAQSRASDWQRVVGPIGCTLYAVDHVESYDRITMIEICTDGSIYKKVFVE